MRAYTNVHLDGHEVVTTHPGETVDELVLKSPSGETLDIILPHRIPAPLRLAFLRSLAHAAEELAEQIELTAIADAKTAGIALATTDSEYDR